LYFSDIIDRRVYRWAGAGSPAVVCEIDDEPAGLGWLPDGSLLVVSTTRRQVLRLADGVLSLHADLSSVASGPESNDMVVDRHGRAYVTNFGFDLEGGEPPRGGPLACIQPSGDVSVAADELIFGNGLAIRDDDLLVVAESFGYRLTAFVIGEGSQLSNRRILVTFPEGWTPDGICLDSQGAIWVTVPSESCIVRVGQDGAVTDKIETGDRRPYACVLGGEDLCDLLICTALSHEREICLESVSGRIERTRVSVPGAGQNGLGG
jgi:sugar lactone lactonase YvrE